MSDEVPAKTCPKCGTVTEPQADKFILHSEYAPDAPPLSLNVYVCRSCHHVEFFWAG